MTSPEMGPSLSDRLRRMLVMSRDREFGEFLIRHELLKSEQLEAALNEGDLARILVEKNLISSDDLARASKDFGVEELSRTRGGSPVSMPPEVEDARRVPDRIVAGYILVSRLGGGGASEVWKAWDLSVGRWIALKRSLAAPHSDAETQRFRREAVAAGRLTHPAIVPVHAAGEEGGRPWLAMGLVEGKTLDEVRLPLQQTLEIMKTVALAVHHAHEQGVIHRDIKPANLLIDGKGSPWVCDFGIAHLVNFARLTATGMVHGTAPYMAPEQARGETVQPESAVDVYALGATLYRLVTGSLPYEGASFAEVVRKIGESEPPPPRERVPDFPRDVEAIILKAMERDPRDRYASAAELAADLERHLAGKPTLARAPSRMSALWRRTASRRRLVWVGLPVLLGVAWLLAPARRADLEPAVGFLESARNELDRAESMLYDSDVPPEKMHACVSQAESHVRKALAIAPNLALAHHRQGEIWELRGRFSQARTSWERALSIDPGLGAARFRLGKILLLLSYLESLDLWGEDDRVLSTGGESLAREGSRMIELARREESGFEDEVQLQLGSALVAYFRRDLEAARRACTEGVGRFQARRGAEEFFWLLGIMAQSKTEAITAFDQAVARRPMFALATYSRASTRRDLKQTDGALADFDRAITVSPGFAEAYLFRGSLRAERNDVAGAVADFDWLIREDLLTAGAYNGRGFVKGKHLNDLDGAIADLTEAVRLKPDTYDLAYAQRAEVFLRKGRVEDAIADAVRGYRIKRWAFFLTLLVRAHVAKGDYEGGMRCLDAMGIALDHPSRHEMSEAKR